MSMTSEEPKIGASFFGAVNPALQAFSKVGTALGANFAQDPRQRELYQLQQQQEAQQDAERIRMNIQQWQEGLAFYAQVAADPRSHSSFQPGGGMHRSLQTHLKIGQELFPQAGMDAGMAASMIQSVLAQGQLAPPPEDLVKIYDPVQGREVMVPRSQVTAGAAAGPSMQETTAAEVDRARQTGEVGLGFDLERIGAQGAQTRSNMAFGADLDRQNQRAQSPAGQAVEDRQRLIGMYGEGSPQVQRFDELTAGGGEQDLPAESAMRAQFTQQSQSFIKVRDAFGKIALSAENPSPAGDLSMIFGYMKLLDPESSVREGEQATAQNATSVPARIRNMYNKVMSGETLTPEQRQDFLDRSEQLFGVHLTAQRNLEKQFTGIAERSKIDPRNIVVDYVAGMDAAEGNTPDGLPSGSKLVGYLNGKPVYETPDGKRVQVVLPDGQ